MAGMRPLKVLMPAIICNKTNGLIFKNGLTLIMLNDMFNIVKQEGWLPNAN